MYFTGPNPTVDIIVIAGQETPPKVLLIRRAQNSPTEAGKWALPGGFQETDALKGERWRSGKETSIAAAVRELQEETNLVVASHDLSRVGTYEGGGRDPRDTRESWAKSTAWLIDIGQTSLVEGKDDADRAEWVDLAEINKRELAFDHGKILKDAIHLWQQLKQDRVQHVD